MIILERSSDRILVRRLVQAHGESVKASYLALVLLILLYPSAAVTRADEIDIYARSFIAKRNIPGLSLAVVRAGKLIKVAGYGMANLELPVPAAPETVYEIGSITKQFTAEAVMLLVEEGKLGLDDTLAKHLDALPPTWQPLTLRQLLTHTSGLKDWEADHLLSFRREYSAADFIALMSPFALDFAPGEGWSYTNTAYPLLGMVVAQASGKPYDAFVEERIFKPLEMRATHFSRPEDILPHRAGGYVDQGGRLQKGEPLRPRLVEPNGGILSSVLDLAKWERVLYTERLLKRASLNQMQTLSRLRNGKPTPSGIGVFVDTVRGHRLIVHNGSTMGGFSSVFYHYPDDHLTVIVLCNIDRGDAVNQLATRVAGYYVSSLSLNAPAE
jgi:CubicO group peptidase (beta-lactamase class C family)